MYPLRSQELGHGTGMNKAMKNPLIALSVLMIQLVVLLGYTTTSKSAQYKPNENVNTKINYKQISQSYSQSYYERHIKGTIKSLPDVYTPVMYPDQRVLNSPELKTQAGLRDELNYQKNDQITKEQCLKKMINQSSFDDSGGSYYRIQGDDIYYTFLTWDSACAKQWEKIGRIGQIINTDYDSAYKSWNKQELHREGREICIYSKQVWETTPKKSCYDYKQW